VTIRSTTGPVSEAPVSQWRQSRFAVGCGVAFLSIFVLIGLGAGWAMLARPVLQVLAARSWVETPCVVVSSRVQTHPGSKGSTYSIEVEFQYEVGQRIHRSTRYAFMDAASSGLSGKEAVVRDLPAGSETVCWVDPDDPREAVLVRGFTPMFLIGLVPLLFVAAGGGGIALLLWSSRAAAAKAGRRAWLPAAERDGPAAVLADGSRVSAAGVAVLEPKATPLAKLLVVAAVALLWNGIVAVFVYFAVQEWRQGSSPGCLTLFLVPFVLVGLGLLASVPYQLLALFNPRPRLELSAREIALGGTVDLAWRFSGRAARISRLAIVLEGREEATYRRGTSSTTDRHVFTTLPIADSERGAAIAEGRATVAVPADTMHSLETGHNRVVWSLKLHGDIAHWPDVEEEFELVVRPSGGRA
jgi:hypothetical protein